ncbi:MAG: magnesium/cobalt transporter CorA [Thauera sp.]|jgi:magnesium transporter|nr:magnesium/cobalt transporter CorA [Thauera sp.]
MLINCSTYQRGQKVAECDLAQLAAGEANTDGFSWVGLADAERDELALLQAHFGLHDLAVEDAEHGAQRPKIDEYDDVSNSLFVVLHLLEQRDGELQQGELHIFVGAHYIISIRHRSTIQFASVRSRCEREHKQLAKGPGYVLYALMDAVVDSYFPLIAEIENELDQLEEQIFAKGAGRSNIRHLYELKCKLNVLKHAVSPLLEASAKLHSGRVPEVCFKSRHYFRDVYDHLVRLNTSLDSIRDTINIAIQVNLSMVTIDQTEISKRLAAWAGIFAVATALAGIWGMNFSNMPELDWQYGYPLALGAIAGLGGLLYWRFRKAGWL